MVSLDYCNCATRDVWHCIGNIVRKKAHYKSIRNVGRQKRSNASKVLDLLIVQDITSESTAVMRRNAIRVLTISDARMDGIIHVLLQTGISALMSLVACMDKRSAGLRAILFFGGAYEHLSYIRLES